MHLFTVQIEKYKFILDVYRTAVLKRESGEDIQFELRQLSDLLAKCIFTAFGATAPCSDCILILKNHQISESAALQEYDKGIQFYHFLHKSLQDYLKENLVQN